MPMRVKKLAAWRWARIYSRRRKSPLILPDVVMTAGRKRKFGNHTYETDEDVSKSSIYTYIHYNISFMMVF